MKADVERERLAFEVMRTQMNARAVAERWDVQYGKLTSAELNQLALDLQSTIDASTTAYFTQEFEAGRYEVFDEKDPVLTASRENPFIIKWLRFDEGTTDVKRVILPADAFPNEYRTRELSRWLSERAAGVR